MPHVPQTRAQDGPWPTDGQGSRSDPLRLLVVTPRAFPEVGGVEKHVFETTRRLAAAGLQVTLLTTDLHRTLPEEETIDSVRVLRVPAAPKRADYYFAPALLGRIQALETDLIHCQSYHTMVCPLAMLAATRRRIPYVVSFHSGPHASWTRGQFRRLQQRTLSPLLRRAARLICVSSFERSVFTRAIGLPEERFEVIPNGCDLPDPGHVEPPGHTLITSVGRLERYKGHQRLIRALPHILPRIPDARALIVGDGPYKDELIRLAGRLGVQDAVEFRTVPPDDRLGMARLMRQSSLVVQLSDYESGGIAAIEAAGIGTPVLVRRVAALCDVAAAGFAESVCPEAGDRDIADAAITQLSKGSTPRPQNLPTWDACAERLLALYESVHQTRGVGKRPTWIAGAEQPLHVTMATARFLPERGGTELHTHEVAQRMAKQGIKVTILSTALRAPFPRESFDGPVRVIRVRAWPPGRDYYLAPKLIRTIRRGRTDLLHCQGYHTFVAPLAMLAALSAHIPYVVTLHSGGHASRLRRALRPTQALLLRPLLRRARQLIAVSEFEAELFARRTCLPLDSFRVIPSGVDLPASTAVVVPDAPLLLSVGRVESYKGHHRVVEALPALDRARPGIRLRVVGSGSYEPELRRLADRLGVSHLLEIAPVPAERREEMAALLSRAACVVNLSEYESQGLATQEALALGRPLLVSDNSPLDDLRIHPNVRTLGSHANGADVARAVIELLDAPLAEPPSLPTWDECVAALVDVYRESLAGGPRNREAQ
jgi:glycosyltransferase involved in cell wall biosynthesis